MTVSDSECDYVRGIHELCRLFCRISIGLSVC